MITKAQRLLEIAVDDGVGSAAKSIMHFVRNRTVTRLKAKVNDEVETSVGDVSARFNTPTVQEYKWVTNIEEREVIRHIMEEIQRGDVFWDIGANIGIYSCLIGNSSEVEIVAIEPHPSNHQKLRENIAKNSLENRSKTLECGVGARSGTQTLFLSDDWDTNHSTVERVGDGKEIDVKSGDDIIEAHGYPDVVKIDVEGAEMDVISGMTQTLNHCRAVYCEAHHIYGVGQTEVREKLANEGFTVSIVKSTEKTTHLVGTNHG